MQTAATTVLVEVAPVAATRGGRATQATAARIGELRARALRALVVGSGAMRRKRKSFFDAVNAPVSSASPLAPLGRPRP
eukprot:1722841-Prymnesium_polylepis.1